MSKISELIIGSLVSYRNEEHEVIALGKNFIQINDKFKTSFKDFGEDLKPVKN